MWGDRIPLSDFEPEKIATRFWPKVKKGRGCWHWSAAKMQSVGYGRFSVGRSYVGAHRVSYWLSTGVDPGDRLVCHTCDTRDCVRPDHLFLGTNADNQRDKIAKDRHKKNQNSDATHCIRGHAFDRTITTKSGTVKRRCSICYNEYHKIYERNRRRQKRRA